MFWPNAGISNVRTAMMVEPATALPAGEDWQYEFQWPGERVFAVKDETRVRLLDILHRRDLTNRFAAIAALVVRLAPSRLVLDGVIATLQPDQLAAFDELTAPSGASERGPLLRFVAVDLLWCENDDARRWPLTERIERLRGVIRDSGILWSRTPRTPPPELLTDARRLGADAVIAKRRGSRYRPFGRSGDWVRVPVGPLRSGRSRCGTPFDPAADSGAGQIAGAERWQVA